MFGFSLNKTKPSCTQLGRFGEDQAADFLRRHGYRILERNFRCRLGEVDIIARQEGVICFIEVKTRRTISQGSALEAVSVLKQKKIAQAACVYLSRHGLEETSARFDVVAATQQGDELKMELVQNAFEMDGDW